MITFHNTQTRQLEAFSPITPGRVQMYHCGPTVYARAHIGNLSAFIYWDVMRRMFESLNYEVVQVMNFTDIGHIVSDADQGDDKMVSALIESGKELTIENLHEHGKEIAATYLTDSDNLNILRPHHIPYASHHIDEDIAIIEKLFEKGAAYVLDDAIYFDTGSINNYDTFNVHGDLDSNHGRISSNLNKKSPRDFSLWKFSENNSDIGWNSPWGVGFPGWHIECSAMSWRYLGETFDIHTGGIEHIAVHHTNEIAQSETAFGKEMARCWLHNNHLQLNSEKFAKSTGNVMYLDELETYGLHPMDFRYLVLTSHYRSEQNITIESLRSARKARKSLKKAFDKGRVNDQTDSMTNGLLKILSLDLDTPKTIAEIRTKTKAADPTTMTTLRSFMTNVLGITFDDLEATGEMLIPKNIQELADDRLQAKQNQNYEVADKIRDELKGLGYGVKDSDNGQELYKL